MNYPTFKFLLVVAGLVCTVQSSFKDPPEPILPGTPTPKPEQYGNHIEQMCEITMGGGWTYEGTCQFPLSVDQCEDGISMLKKSRSRRPCPIDWHRQSVVEEGGEEQDENEPRRYLCCIRQACGPGLAGHCQNIYKRCPGTWLISALDGTPVENNCPVKDEAFVACCDSREPSSKAEDSTTKSSSLMLGLCSTSNEKACRLRDDSQIPISLDSQQSLGASLGAGLKNGYGMYDGPPLGNQANGVPQIKDQSYLNRDKDSLQYFPGDFPDTVAQMTTDPLQHDGWDNLPPLDNSAPIGRGSYLWNSPYAQALAAAAAAPDSNTETNNDFTDWRVTT